MEFIEIDIDILAQKYNNGASMRSLAKEHGTSHTTIKKKLRKAGVLIYSSQDQIHRNWHGHKQSSRPASSLTPELLKDLWNKLSLNAIMIQTNTTIPHIKKLAKQLNLPKYQPPKWTPKTKWDNQKWLHKHYTTQKMSLNTIAALVQSTSETIKRKLIKHHIPLRTLQESVDIWNNSSEGKEARKRGDSQQGQNNA